MKNKALWVAMSGFLMLSLLIAACGQGTTSTSSTTSTITTTTNTQKATPTSTVVPVAETTQKEPTTTNAEKPKYGGTLLRTLNLEPVNWGPIDSIAATTPVYEDIWAGDWAKGPAGGYGTKETDWAHSYDRWDLDTGFIAESVKWKADFEKNEGIITYQIRQGIHYGLNPKLEASRMVNGRELTADDVVWCLSIRTKDPAFYLYKSNAELRTANITKTGPWEVTIKLPLVALISGVTRFTDSCWVYPPEAYQKFNKMLDWRTSCGTGPYMQTDYVPGSEVIYIRNPNYYMKNPVGPGKGDQLPYLDGLRNIIIPDESTRLAALRTGKVDHMIDINYLDAGALRKQVPVLHEIERVGSDGRGTPAFMRIDKVPFGDVRVRRALVMAIDYYGMRKSLFGGLGSLITYPFNDSKGYHDIYLGIDDPDLPASTKELFSYDPEKAKQLLKEAGFPNGFKTQIIVTNTKGYGGVNNIDYYSVVKDFWAKIGVELLLDIKETSVQNNIRIARTHEALCTNTTAPVATFYLGIAFQGTGQYNLSMLDDPVINKALEEVRLAAVTDMVQAEKLFREKISKYVLDQAFAVPNLEGVCYTMWWPWIKNYSGERTIGYDDGIWPSYIWIDQDLKKSMGY